VRLDRRSVRPAESCRVLFNQIKSLTLAGFGDDLGLRGIEPREHVDDPSVFVLGLVPEFAQDGPDSNDG